MARTKASLGTGSRRSVSAMMRTEESFRDSADKSSMHHFDMQDEISATQIFRAGSSHPFKEDFVQGSDTAASFLVSWPLTRDVEGSRDSFRASMLNALHALCENADIHVTPPFHILDGKGDKLATVCVQTTRPDVLPESTRREGRSPGLWLQCCNALKI